MNLVNVIGYGNSAKAFVKFVNNKGIKAYIFDDAFTEISEDKNGNQLIPATFSEKFDVKLLTLISPGVPPHNKLVKRAKNPISEYDYFSDFMPSLGSAWISGTNGKTTTTQMSTFLLEDFNVKNGGNIGLPIADLVGLDVNFWILETSSFMLEYTKKCTPRIYALLPVRDDHTSWHGSFEAYLEAKLSIVKRLKKSDFAIIPKELCKREEVKNFKGEIFLYDDSMTFAKDLSVSVSNLPFKEPFLLDALLSLKIASIFIHHIAPNTDKSLAPYVEKLKSFKIGAHRIEEFFDAKNRLWVDDSKGTNIDATINALKCYKDKEILLILGGDDKDADLEPLFTFMQDLCITIFAIGSNTTKLEALAKAHKILCVACTNLHIAVKQIDKLFTNTKQIALLSPAAASLDQFSGYKERGEKFKELIRNLL